MKILTALLAFALSCNVFGQHNTIDHMVLIPKGEFTMGKNSANISDWKPEHIVVIDSFYMDKYEVTNQQYYDFCNATNRKLPIFWGIKEFRCGLDFPDYPIIGVSFYDAEAYARWAGKRLPTEAEWEYAARGGLTNKNFPTGDQIDSTRANYGKKYKGTVKTGIFQPNDFGLYDMSGNVWEWVSDNYGSDYYGLSPVENPKGPENGRFKVIRGGSWHSGAMCTRVYFRNGLSSGWVDFAVGFRCVKSCGGR